MKRLLMTLMSACAAFVATAAEVSYSIKANTLSGEADVRTDGATVYAYTAHAQDRTIVNGIEFAPAPVYAALGDNIDLSSFQTKGAVIANLMFVNGYKGEWTASASYKQLLGAGYYDGDYSDHTVSFTLNHLTVGKRYLVQFWICRNDANTDIQYTIGGTTFTNAGENGLGTVVTGTFTADADTQAIRYSCNSESVLNAIQLRCLDEGRVTWQASWTTGEGDVRTDGKLVYAYVPNSSVTANGVTFAGAADSESFGGNVAFSRALGSIYTGCYKKDPSTGAPGYSDAYANLVTKAFYDAVTKPDRAKSFQMTLKNLTVGHRYLVQFWSFDNRDVNSQWMSILLGNGALLRLNDGTTSGPGSFAVGTFTAASSTQTINVHASWVGATERSEQFFGPLQVRDIDNVGSLVSWTKGATQPDGSVDLRGEPVFAYAGTAVTIGDTVFKAVEPNVTSVTPFGDDAAVFAGANLIPLELTGIESAFVSGDSVLTERGVTPPTAEARYLLRGGAITDLWKEKMTLRLKGLTPGRRYLLQFWVCDTRVNGNGKTLTVSAPQHALRYRDDAECPLGEYETVVFHAAADTYDVALGLASLYLNAIQLRRLDGAGADAVSDGGWTVQDNAKDESLVRTDGTLLYAYSPASFTLDNGVAFSAAPVDQFVWGEGDVTFDNKMTWSYGGFAGQTDAVNPYRKLLANAFGGDGTVKDYQLTLGNLEPGCTYVVQLFVADLRNDGNGSRQMKVGGVAGRFGHINFDTCVYGSVFTRTFAAKGSTDTFKISYSSKDASQLNGLQVRKLGRATGNLPQWTGGADGTWSDTGANFTLGGESMEGLSPWSAENHAKYTAFFPDTAVPVISGTVYAGGVLSEHELTINGDRIYVDSEITAPLATVNADYLPPCLMKSQSGTTVIAGNAHYLKAVRIENGELRLVKTTELPLDVVITAPGRLVRATSDEPLNLASLAGDGTLAGPGGIDLDSGTAFALSDFSYADGFSWNLRNGSTLVREGDLDASNLVIGIDDPAAYDGKVVLTVAGTATGKPSLKLSDADAKRYTLKRTAPGVFTFLPKQGLCITVR